jgi:hypothetical protein
MNATESEDKHSPTKLILFYSNCNQSCNIRERLTNIPRIIQDCGYDFTFEMPTVHAVENIKKEKYLNWRGKERERIIYGPYAYCHLLKFSKELSAEELKFWRIFKLGYLTRQLIPDVHR